MPPIAAMPGEIILEKLDNSPSNISLFNSKPITKKNIAINPSLTQCSTDLDNVNSPISIDSGRYLRS